jgi:hypothetical protein
MEESGAHDGIKPHFIAACPLFTLYLSHAPLRLPMSVRIAASLHEQLMQDSAAMVFSFTAALSLR